MGYEKTYTSFAGTDIVASITIHEDIPPIVIGELQTISYSIHREVVPVRTLGRINPVGFTGGQRTIAGSLIFTVFNKNFVYDILEMMKKHEDIVGPIFGDYLADEMPQFDVHIVMQNEYGQQAGLTIEGVVIVDEGQVMSIEDMITENTMSYLAKGLKPLHEIPSIKDGIVSGSGNPIVKDVLTPPGLPTRVETVVDGKNITVNFVKDPNAEYTFLDLWCDQIPDYETKGNSISFTVDNYNTQYSYMLMSQAPKNSQGKYLTSGWSQAYRFMSGDVIESPSSIRVSEQSTGATIYFTKGKDADTTEVQVVPFNGPLGSSDFNKSFENTEAIITAETDGDRVEIYNLQESTRYYFRLRSKTNSDQVGRWSSVPYNFRTKPWI